MTEYERDQLAAKWKCPDCERRIKALLMWEELVHKFAQDVQRLRPNHWLEQHDTEVREQERKRIARALIAQGLWTNEMSEIVTVAIREADDED